MIDKKSHDTIVRIINCIENDSASDQTDYASVYLYHDGPNKQRQVTLGRGYTSTGGSLWKVLQKYIDKNGENADFLRIISPKCAASHCAKTKLFYAISLKRQKRSR